MMRTAMALAAMALLAASALANPVAFDDVYITFAENGIFPSIDAMPGEQLDAYIAVEMWESYQPLKSVSFKLEVTPGMGTDYSFENLMPGGETIGSWDTGITLVAPDCIDPFDLPVLAGVLRFTYTGTPGDIVIADHPTEPRWLVDCYGGLHIYCVFTHGAVDKDPIGGDCEGQPVETTTWSSVKSLYR